MEFDWDGRGDLLFRMFRAVTEGAEAKTGFQALLEVAAEGFGADSGSLALTVPETGEMQVVAALDASPGQVGRILPPGKGILGWVIGKGEPLLLQGDASEDPRFQGLHPERRRPKSAICWPIENGKQVIGALSLNRDAEREAFSEDEFQQGKKLLQLAGVGVENLWFQSDRARRVGQLQSLVDAQRELQQVERSGAEIHPEEEALYNRIAELVARILGARYAAVGLFHADGSVRSFHATGVDQDTQEAIGQLPEGKGLLGDLFRHAQPERVNAIPADPRFQGFPEGHPEMLRLVAHPLRQGSRTFGVIYAADRTDGLPFTEEDSAYLGVLAAQIVDLLVRLELMESLEGRAEDLHQQLLTAVKVFANLLDLRAPQLAGHGRKVAERAVAIGRRLGVDEAYREDLHIAGLLHDVGMLSLPERVLQKPYCLLHASDRKRVREHPTLGEASLMAMGSLDRAARFIRHHHEYLDGSGYPDHLQGEAIPLGARILTVANEFHDLVRGNLFVNRLSPEKALQYLYDHVGGHYDRDVVAALAEELEMAGDGLGAAPDGAEGWQPAEPPADSPAPEKAQRGGSETADEGTARQRRRRHKRADEETAPGEETDSGAAPGAAGEADTPTRVLESPRLQEGMTLARDLVTEEGMLLLSKDHVLDDALIQKIRYFEHRLGRRFQVTVYDDRKSQDA